MASAKGVVKWGGIVLGAVVALALIAGGMLFYLVSRLDVRAEVSRAVESATGRQLTIEGSVGVSFWPVIGLHAARASLANVQGGRAPALAAIDDIHVGVEIAPLFRREVVVRQIVLDHPRIALEVDAQGRPNWNLQPAHGQAPPRPSSTPSAAQGTRFTLSSIAITDGEFSYYDARKNVAWTISDADLTTALTNLDQPIRLNGALTYNEKRVNLTLEIGRPRAAMTGQATPLTLDARSDLIEMNFQGQATGATSEVAGTLRANGPNLRDLSAWAGSPITGGVGLEDFAVSGNIEVGAQRAKFTNAGFALDHFSGRGDFELTRSRGKPTLTGTLQIFDIDLNPYLTGQMPAPPADAAAPAAAGPTTSTATSVAVVQASDRTLDLQAAPNDRPIDFSALGAANANLEITTGAVLIQHMKLDATQMSMTLNDGYLIATLHRINLYGGSAHGRLEIDTREPIAVMKQDMTLDGVDAQRFLSDTVNFQTVEGRTEMDLHMETRGRNARELIAAADGRLHIEVVNGALRGVDLGGLSRTLRNAMNNELISANARTPFQGFSATVNMRNGVLASENLSFNTPDLAITGIGLVDLNAHTMEARLAPRSPRGGIVVPFTARGPFTGLRYETDLRGRARTEILSHVRAVSQAH